MTFHQSHSRHCVAASAAFVSPAHATSRLAFAPRRFPALIATAAAAVALLAASPSPAALLQVPANYPTIQAAVNAAGPGDTVEVATGVYHEFVVFPASGSAGNPITLKAKAGNTPVIDGTGLVTTDMEGLIYIENRSYITISGMEIANLTATSPSHFPAGIWVRGSSHHIQILGNSVHDIRNPGCANCGAHAIGVYGTSASGSIHDVVIDGNEVKNCVLGLSESVVVNGNVENFTITHNVVHDNNNIGIDAIGFEGECVGCSDALDQARDGVIADNLVYNIDSLPNPSYHGYRSADGIYVDGGTRIVIERNVVHDANIGIELASEHAGKATSSVIMRSNFVYRSNIIGIAIGGYDIHRGSTENCSVVHNTLFDNDTDQSSGGEMLIQFDTRSNVVENNIFVANAQNQFLANEFVVGSGNVIDHNIYFSAGGAASSTWVWKTTPYTGFAAWQAGSGNDAHSVFVDPLLANPAAGDLHLSPGSPAIGAAVALAPAVAGTTDIDGTPRVSGAAADIGADELACGNGIVDADEACDDGNLTSGDGCDANCTFTACGNGIRTSGEDCDDGNLTSGDCCSSLCNFETNGSPCDDGEACTYSDACDGAGACRGTAGVEPSCLLPTPASAGSQLALTASGGTSDRLAWSWARGPEVLLSAFGDPVGADDYALCVFADDGMASRLLVSAAAPSGASWKTTGSTGFKYTSRDFAPDGLQTIQLKSGAAGRAKIKVKGRGAGLGLSTLGFGPSATVSTELRNTTTGNCFAAVYPGPFRVDTATRFQDKSN